ncbi:uncharacterized protein LOC119578625 [Penaeus monodon]|uniref:uncharacterized protein LOC119578625 n=1 Tax=Penaeus monodon TaxID=6687 RepID=UPI0018A71F51|nr:uncharacterized protein LOC119578625 [Penaeus monodon]
MARHAGADGRKPTYAILAAVLVLCWPTSAAASSVLQYSIISWGGLRGNVTFSWGGPGTNVTVEASLEVVGVEVTPKDPRVRWGYTLGRAIRYRPAGVGGERTYETRFFSPMGGSIWIRSWTWNVGGVDSEGAETKGVQTTIFTDVFNTADDDPPTGNHDWAIFITDILDDRDERSSCNFLSRIYDPLGREKCNDESCPMGSLSHAFGELRVGTRRSRFSRKMYSSTDFALPDLSGPRKLYIAVMGALHPDHLWACAKMREVKPKKARAIFNGMGVTGEVRFEQTSVFAPTDLTLDLRGLAGRAGGFHVHELPSYPPKHAGDFPCGKTGGHYNPFEVDPSTSPEPGLGSHDRYELGDLSGKHGLLTGLQEVEATVTDHNLPLFGPRSVLTRSLVLHRDSGERWLCANIRPTEPQVRAAVTFRYPLVGEIIFEQEADNYLADTTVFVSYLVYSDGSRNSTGKHRWHVHDHVPGKDFYNWTMRCVSAGGHYNPYKISLADKVYRYCDADTTERCEVGDLEKRHGSLYIAGSVREVGATQRLFTDTNLPLSGPKSVLGHSVVLHDDFAPKHRGDRMACAGIFRKFRHKGVVSKWYSQRGAGNVEGKVEFIQESEFDITNTEVDLRGLQGIAKGYHVHMVPVEKELQFPCAASTTLGHYNPLNITPSDSPPPDQGTDDLYEAGDLAGKYGTLEGLTWKKDFYNDSNLHLFGSTSIMGRSIVIHKREKNARWFCGSIGWGYSPAEARQVSAIASFHNPQGYAWGYIRLRQLVYMDDSFGETFIEVNLRHPGSNNRNVVSTWLISLTFLLSYLFLLGVYVSKDYYERECSPEVPLRCDVGDLSGRLGPIDVGDQRYVFVDKNLPLTGPHGIMNKAIIIHRENAGVERFACANIEPDNDIIKWVLIRKPPKFSLIRVMDDIREVLGAPEWYLAADLQTVSESVDQKCATFVVNFMGPQAHQLEQDFSRILAGGILDHPTISIRGVYPDPKRKKKVPYRTCGGLEEEDVFEDEESWWNVLTGSNTPDHAASTAPFFAASFCTLVASLALLVLVTRV